MTDIPLHAGRLGAPSALGHPSPRAGLPATVDDALVASWLRGAVSEHLPAMNLSEVLARLPAPDRVILYLHAVQGLSAEQAAPVLGIDALRARKRYLDALLQLRAEWQKSPAARAFWRGQPRGLDVRPEL